ncbi:lysine-specific demethylase hairless [Haemorhous mexicanus]|uniref:lysine-specific demethylase hairless n=1 Tax=Haemorhous mexicanus TaxID=30427 RepID=UPI0028BD1A68|nr:lysine-specific demethylase hairless [Haemorhous mexicanus]
MASDARMGETPARWRRAPEAAQDSRGMESSGMLLSRSAAAELGLPAYPEPGKLSYAMEKGCPWRGSEGCLGPVRELAGGHLGCPYPPAPPCLRDALSRPKDGAELPPLLPPRNGQPKAGWGEPCKEHPGPRWAEAVLAPLALYSHAYHRYPLPVPGLDAPRPGTAGKPRGAAGDAAGDPPAFHHCPFLVEAKHSPFLLSSLLPGGPPAEPPFGGAGAEGPGPVRDGRFAGPEWHLGSYGHAWGQPLYLGVPPRCKAALPPFDDCSSSGNKEFYAKKGPGFHPSSKNHAAPQLLGKSQAGQDRDGEGEPAVPELPAAPWRDGRAGGSSAVPAPHPRTPPPGASHPLLLLQPGSGGCGGTWVGARPHGADFSMDTGPGRPSEPKDERLGYRSAQPRSPSACGEPNPSPLLADGHYPAALARPEPPPGCLCPTSGCDGCPGVGCGVPNPFEPTLGTAGGRFPCPPSNHTKLKKTWLTRHSEQSLPRSKASRRDGGPEPPGEGKRSAKRPHGTADGPRPAGEGAGAAKRGTKATAGPGGGTESAGDAEERRMELGEEEPPSRAGEPWCLQSLPCTALPPSIPRCCACVPRAGGDPEGEEEEPPESTCRLLHFRRFALGDNGELSVDGLCSLGEAQGDAASPDWGLRNVGSRNVGSRSVGSSLCLAKYLLGVLGDPFCAAVCRDRDTWPGAPGGPEGVTGWRRGEGASQLCDACQRGFFNSHWSCARCGFQLCPECHRSRREESGPEGPALPPECTPGRDHHVSSLVPTQFVPTRVLTRLWKLLHEVRIKFGIESHCPCGEGAAEQSLEEPPGRQEPPGAAVPTLPPLSHGPADPARPIKEEDGVGNPDRVLPRAESPEGGPPSPGQPPARGGTVQSTTLCDLLASTAVKLCLGQDGVRMAFAPVAPALPSDNRLTSILDSIIARVVEKKIQERQAGSELSPPGSPEPPASHCVLAPSGLLWLHDPGHASNYKLFQEHWRQGQPVLVSGLQKRLEPRLWAPESFQPSGQEEEEVEAVNLRAPRSRVRMSSREFWDGFAASTASPEQEQSSGDLLKLESGFGDTELSRATNLRASLPLPEYCGASGRLNLATYLRGQRGRRWLRPRLCVAYAVRPQERNFGTKPLTVEAADSISVLAHAAPAPREPLHPADMDELEAPLRERLGAGGRPGALWHIFRAEDAPRIRDFLRKAAQEPGQDGAAAAEPPGRYLDPALRRRLRDECGVSGWSLLQLPGDAVLVPAGAPHQVRSLSGTISVEQQFLSPESAVRLRQLDTGPAGTPRHLRAQLDGMIFVAVREALEVLRGCQ